MKAKKYIILSACVLACVAMIFGLCVLFFGSETVDLVPNSLSVEYMDGQYELVAEYNPNYKYQFQIEQMFDDSYIVIDTIESKTNTYNLKNSDFQNGVSYRFSARFKTESGASGQFCQPVEWLAVWYFENSIDFESIKVDFEDEMISWDSVAGATNYILRCLDIDGNFYDLESEVSSVSFSTLPVGQYRVFFYCTNNNLNPCLTRKSFVLDVIRDNEILSVKCDANNFLSIECKYEAKEFEIVVENGTEKQSLTISAGEPNKNGLYFITDASALLNSVNLSSCIIKIKACGSRFVGDSEFVTINLNRI